MKTQMGDHNDHTFLSVKYSMAKKKTAIEWGFFYLIFVVVCVPRLTYYTTNTGASDGAQKNEYQFNKFA